MNTSCYLDHICGCTLDGCIDGWPFQRCCCQCVSGLMSRFSGLTWFYIAVSIWQRLLAPSIHTAFNPANCNKVLVDQGLWHPCEECPADAEVGGICTVGDGTLLPFWHFYVAQQWPDRWVHYTLAAGGFVESHCLGNRLSIDSRPPLISAMGRKLDLGVVGRKAAYILLILAQMAGISRLLRLWWECLRVGIIGSYSLPVKDLAWLGGMHPTRFGVDHLGQCINIGGIWVLWIFDIRGSWQ